MYSLLNSKFLTIKTIMTNSTNSFVRGQCSSKNNPKHQSKRDKTKNKRKGQKETQRQRHVFYSESSKEAVQQWLDTPVSSFEDEIKQQRHLQNEKERKRSERAIITLQENEKKQLAEKDDTFNAFLDNHEEVIDGILQRRNATNSTKIKTKSYFKAKSTPNSKSNRLTKNKGYRSEKEKSFVKRKDREQHFQERNSFVSDTFQNVPQSDIPNFLLEFTPKDARWITITAENGQKFRLSSSHCRAFARTMYNLYEYHQEEEEYQRLVREEEEYQRSVRERKEYQQIEEEYLQKEEEYQHRVREASDVEEHQAFRGQLVTFTKPWRY